MRLQARAALLGTAIALATMPGGEVPDLSPDQAEIASYVEEAMGYWEGQGVNLSATELVFIDEDETVWCGPERSDSDAPIAFYCLLGKIVFSSSVVDRLSNKPQAARVYTAYHEVSHAVQAARGQLTGREYDTAVELHADCLVGPALYATQPEDFGRALGYVAAQGFDIDTGTIGGGRAYFMEKGAAGEDCDELFPID